MVIKSQNKHLPYFEQLIQVKRQLVSMPMRGYIKIMHFHQTQPLSRQIHLEWNGSY